MSQKSSFFSDPFWLSACDRTWLGAVSPLPWGSSAACSVGPLALLGRRSLTRHHGVLSSRVIALNQSLWPEWDQVFIEFNGFFGQSRDRFPELLERLLSDLARDAAWDEFRLSGLQSPEFEAACALASGFGLDVHLFDERPAPYRDLCGDRASGDVLSGLSSNLRSQLRRSRRRMTESLGALELDCANSPQQAWEWLEVLAPWHRARWSSADGRNRSGFDNPAFLAFHQALIDEGFNSDQIRVWRLKAGNTTVCILYNLRARTTECFYLGAANPTLDPAWRAGLLGHVEVMNRCLQEGMDFYDFMAGEARYKRQLSNACETLYWIDLQRKRKRFVVERLARSLKSRLRQAIARRNALSSPVEPD
jgi:hypothetical protein